MGKYLKYLKYLTRHKWFVAIECFKRGIFLRGLLHDNSKLSWGEFKPYAIKFYTKELSPHFEMAWKKHLSTNKHHWQWWVLMNDDGTVEVLEMDIEYALEMVCDWIGVAKALKKPKMEDELYHVKEWYSRNKNIRLHENTRKLVERILYEVC